MHEALDFLYLTSDSLWERCLGDSLAIRSAARCYIGMTGLCSEGKQLGDQECSVAVWSLSPTL